MKKSHQYSYSRWYLHGLAFIYFIILSLNMIVYIHRGISSDGWSLPMTQKILFLSAFVSSLFYMIRPNIGYWGMLVVTIAVLVLAGNDSNAKAVAFHSVVLVLLLLPLLGNFRTRKCKEQFSVALK
jgi:hypothetical protein